MCRIEDAEPWEFFHSAVRKAAKEHVCSECGRRVTKGETYDYAAGKFDGTMSTYKTCQHCVAAREWLRVACGGWLYEGVLEELVEHWDEEPELRSPILESLIAGMRGKWDGLEVPELEPIKASVPVAARS